MIFLGDGQWSEWSDWIETTYNTFEKSYSHLHLDIATCSKTNKTRQRKCNNPKDLGEGRHCTGKYAVNKPKTLYSLCTYQSVYKDLILLLGGMSCCGHCVTA